MKTPFRESLKEVWRWVWSYILSNAIVAVVDLTITALPFFPVHIFPESVTWFGLVIPVQFTIANFVLPALLRGLDKYRYQQSKLQAEGQKDVTPTGVIGYNLLNDL